MQCKEYNETWYKGTKKMKGKLGAVPACIAKKTPVASATDSIHPRQ
jgi:hypothetical protein